VAVKKRLPTNDEPLEPAGLEAIGLRYLDRFDASVHKLRQLLVSRARRSGHDEDRARELVEPLIERWLASGLLDDARFTDAVVHGQRQRGASRRMIEHKLVGRGVPRPVIDAALAQLGSTSELEAAVALVRRRRLGAHRPEAVRESYRRRDLATLARAGFDFETARRALGAETPDEEF
jgi:regulatory protein